MAGICTSSTSPNSCSHRTLTVDVDGTAVTVNTDDAAVLVALTPDEKIQLVHLTARRLRQKGVTLAEFLNRVLVGDEATNVKQYDLIGPGVAITKTNIGTAYVNVSPGLNGERTPVDFAGCTEYRVVLHANLVGTGAFGARVVKDSDLAVLAEQANLGAAGERELDTGWVALPAAFVGVGIIFLRVQAKSTTAADDPIFRSCRVGVR